MLELLAGAGIFAAGWAVGRITRRPKNTGKAICGCGHGIGYHKDRTSACQMTTKHWFDGDTVRCKCQVYSGPELITTFTNSGVAILPPASKE